LSDEETVEQITENKYLQYFVGLKEFQQKYPLESPYGILSEKIGSKGDQCGQLEFGTKVVISMIGWV
jgi:hypothetical protein